MKRTPASGDTLFTAGQVAEMFGVSLTTIAAWDREGRLLPSERTRGGHRRYRVRDLVHSLRADST